MYERKRLIGVSASALILAFAVFASTNYDETEKKTNQAQDTAVPDSYTTLHSTYSQDEEEEIRDEIMYGEVELIAQMIQAEAGTEDELGKRYVADVILNRVDDEDFPDKIEDVIFQMNPVQFASVADGNFDKAAWTVTEECYTIALEEYDGPRQNTEILYFRTDRYGTGTPAFKYGNHYFSTK